MRVLNRTRGTTLAWRAEAAERWSDRLRGLLGRPGLREGEGLVIAPCSSIHTFFMRFAIDAAFLDGDDRVLRVYPELPPWRTTRVLVKARRVVELPAGVLAATGTRPGDRLAFEWAPSD